ncbi:peptidoglycan-N-acetylmuramic acid deacetylase [Salinibacillus kushneri]|uniref:Peptidoglycan-N-acetylmuramic acid deacetylase n=1 Tax=Salinibacillus kushneri TaxID=237682 RepID=A0A1H9YH18_9BACI|nr:polysaccharide deacetylase family protein [Salinibacillus kushneri]SES68299.1 peptidoglycan-N-acetylmuramic acid deacetylase [Salinibacillus kushneri]
MYDSKDSHVLTSINSSDEKTVVLTFDDGPGKVLPQILDILKEEEVPAMFFWQTRLLYQERPWARLVEEGHKIGTHTINHPDLSTLDFNKQYKQLAESVKKIEGITGQKVTYFRPPFGQYNADTIKAANQLGLTSVMWRIAGIDWELKGNSEQIISNVTENLEDGAIILLHELKQTVEALPEMIRIIKEKGYQFTIL